MYVRTYVVKRKTETLFPPFLLMAGKHCFPPCSIPPFLKLLETMLLHIFLIYLLEGLYIANWVSPFFSVVGHICILWHLSADSPIFY